MPELNRYDVENWIREIPTGEFHYSSILKGKWGKPLDGKMRRIMTYLCNEVAEPIVEPCGRKDGYYKRVEEMPEPENWQDVDATIDAPIVLPFNLRDWVWIDYGTSIIIAGSKDSGKTGFIMRTVAMNMNIMNTVFISNMENGLAGIKRRFDAMDIEIPRPAPFKVYHKIEDFHQWMKWPDTIYAIDYIDVPESGEFFMIAPAIGKIQAKATELHSVAIIGLQKKTSSDLAYGGEQTKKKAALYIAMNDGKLKIVAAKIPAEPTIIPKNAQWTFDYDDEGTKFTNIKPYYGD